MRLLGTDIGGTFTDTVLVDDEDIYSVKTKSTANLITGIVNSIEQSCHLADVSLADIDILSHESTIAVNALIEEEGARTALITTAGFRDILEIGEGCRDASLLYNPCGDHETPLIPRYRRYGVEERIGADGDVMQPLDVDSLDRIVDDLQATDVEAVGVTLLHSYRNDEHERRVEARLRERMPDLDISI